MKTTFFFAFFIVAVFTACTPVNTTKPIDENAAKAEIQKTLDSIMIMMENKNIDAFLTYFDDKCIFYGTDPSEKWDKKAFQAGMQQMMADTLSSQKPANKITEIFILDNGAAMAVEQFNPYWSKKVLIRNTSHFTRKGNRWVCDFASYGLIPQNKDLEKINQLVK